MTQLHTYIFSPFTSRYYPLLLFPDFHGICVSVKNVQLQSPMAEQVAQRVLNAHHVLMYLERFFCKHQSYRVCYAQLNEERCLSEMLSFYYKKTAFHSGVSLHFQATNKRYGFNNLYKKHKSTNNLPSNFSSKKTAFHSGVSLHFRATNRRYDFSS